MAQTQIYCGYEIRWRETGERFVALVRLPGEADPPAVINATVSEGMTVLKERTFEIIDAGLVETYRPTL